MNDKAPPSPKDFKIYIAFDEEVSKFYVAETEFSGLVLEDIDPGRLISRLCVAATNLIEVATEKGWNQFELSPGQAARLIPVFHVSIPVGRMT
jgi:hypothetical protein